MEHDLFGDDVRQKLPDVPEDALDAESEIEDSGDRGFEMAGFDDTFGADGVGPIDFGADEATKSILASPPRPAQTVGMGEPEAKNSPPPMFESLEEWVHGWLLPLYRRSLEGSAVTFCREWWRHPEAYLRLDALWKSWEFMRRKPGTGMAVWMRDYCDYHMGVLMREQGPFKGCTIDAHNHEYSLQPWVLTPMPTARHVARLYDRLGVEHAKPELVSVQTQQWDGVDQ
jgi:hypothetical protein